MLFASFDWNMFFDYLIFPDSATWHAMFPTVWIAVLAQSFGVLFGLMSALAYMSRLRPLRILAGLYVWFFRGTPVIVQMFFVYFGANLFLGFDLFPRAVDLGFTTVDGAAVAGMVALAVNEGAFMSEIIRAGIAAVDRGQMEAAMSRRDDARSRDAADRAAAGRADHRAAARQRVQQHAEDDLVARVHRRARAVPGCRHPLLGELQAGRVLPGVAVLYLLLTTIWGFIQGWIERKLGASERERARAVRLRLFAVQPGGRR